MKKLISLLLCVAMLMSMIATVAVAADLPEQAEQTTEKADCVYYVIEPELFTVGGWKFESTNVGSFREQYLYDQGTGTAPATTKLVVPKDATYNLWIHSRDLASDRPGTRNMEFSIDGKVIGKGGTHGKEGWAWQSYEVDIAGGEHVLSVSDDTKWARFDLVMITDDLSYKPSNTLEGLKALDAKVYDADSVQWVKSNPLEGRPADEIAVKFNGEWMQFDVPPMLMNDRTMVPLRAIFEALGAKVTWDDPTQTATGRRNGKEVSVTIGSNVAMVGGNMVSIDQSAALVNDRTLVPLRFVSESYGAEVEWDNDSQTVFIKAKQPKNGIYIGGTSYGSYGTWSVSGVNTDGSVYLVGTTPQNVEAGKTATLADADASGNQPAIASFEVEKENNYKLWVYARDFATNQQGTRYFNVSVNGQMDAKTFGQHASDGFKWEEAGIYTLKEGVNTVEVHDTSGFYARVAGILLTEDMDFVPPNDHAALSKQFPVLDPAANVKVPAFPTWATAATAASNVAKIESDSTKVEFYTINDGVHNFVQNAVFAKDASGNWVEVKKKTDDFGYLLLAAKEANVGGVANGNASVATVIDHNGQLLSITATNGYKMGAASWFIPENYTVLADNKVLLTFPEQNGVTLTALWEMDGRPDPKVTVSANYAKEGFYSIVASNGREYTASEYTEATAPFRIVEQRIPEEASVMIEQYMSTPMAAITVKDGVAAASQATLGIAVDGTEIESEWVYRENSEFGFLVRGVRNGLQGAVMAPIMGSDYSKMTAGGSYSFAYRPIATLEGWYDTYKHVAEDVLDVHDYRSNYYNNLNDAIFNTTDLMMDDEYGGWDPIDMAHYNMEGQDLTSSANPMIAVQRYLLTEDEEILDKRAIPTMAWSLTRKIRNFKRIASTGGAWSSYVTNPPSKIGTPPSEFTASTYGGLYEMSKGGVPVLANVAMEKAAGSGYNAIYNNLTYYRYTGDKKYLDAAIAAGDAYLAETINNEKYMNTLPTWSSFINISYFPNIGSLVDLYEACGEQRFLDAAEEASRIAVTSFWTTGIDNGKGDTPYTVTADYVYNVRDFMKGHTFWWHGEKQWRLGGNDGEARASKDGLVKLPESETVPGWLPTRVGLGLEQASTFSEALNIIMASWVGDVMRVGYYTGDDYLITAARNGVVGRHGTYTGYYQNRYITHQMKENYPYEGPDYTSIYWHHIPPFLAMIEEFLITDFWQQSNTKIEFPRIRQGGYAYFFSSQYGFDSGKMYDVDGLWLWNDRGIVSPDSVQLDYLPAKKDGLLAVAFMNRDKVDTTTTIALGEKVPGGASYTGPATLYDVDGNKSSIDVVNGKFTITVPAKDMVTVMIALPEVKAPSYAGGENRDGDAEMGATISEHTRGRGYTLQLSGDNYYAYIYTTDMDAKDPATAKETYRSKSMTVTYTVNGKTETVKRDVYPFEVLIKVDDPEAILTYEVSVERDNGAVENLGGGELMTAKKSNELGKVFKGTAIASDTPAASQPAATTNTKPEMSAELKKVYKEPFEIKYLTQGTGGNAFRFVTKADSVPFKVTEDLLAGLTATIEFTEKATGKTETLEGYVAKTEIRADGNYTIIIAIPALTVADYDNDKKQTHKFKIVLSDKAVDLSQVKPTTGSASAPATSAKLPAFDKIEIKSYKAQGSGASKLRFVIGADQIPFECSADLLAGLKCVMEATEVATGKVITVETTLAGNEMRSDGGITLVVNPPAEFPAGDYDNEHAKTHKFKLTLYNKGADVSKGNSSAAETPAQSATATSELPDFDKIVVKYKAQGSGASKLRFVIGADQIPFACTENMLAGLKCIMEATEVSTGKVTKVETTLAGNEMRSDGGITLLVNPPAEFPAGNYDNDKAKTHKFVLTLSK